MLAVFDGSNLTLVNSGTGVTLFNNSNTFYGSPTISNGVLYVGSLTDQLYAFGI
ncbi:MAG: PQQ-binding-like beta-propeller repeat protein [Ktedonobacteraceae bacterium]